MYAGATPNTNSQRFSRLANASRVAIVTIAVAGLAACATSNTSTTGGRASSAEPDKLVADAQVSFNNFLRDPDQTWVQENLSRAKAVLIVPQLVKAGFIFGGSGGRAVLVAKDGRVWTGPAFYDLATASVGFQAGVEVSELVMVVMTEKGLNSLLSSSFKIGGDASVAAGPVGAGAKSTVTADLISFSRAKGVYGGVNLDGTVIHPSESLNTAYYGRTVTATDVLIRGNPKSPRSTALVTDVTRATR